jgi:hypothetical protein
VRPAEPLSGLGLADEVRRHHGHGRVDLQLLQQLAALPVGHPGQIGAVELEQVEGHIPNGYLADQRGYLGRVLKVHAALQPPEARPAAVVQRDDLAVQHCAQTSGDLAQRP